MRKKPNPTDVALGARVRARRVQMNMSQTTLGRYLDVSFQQIQKYERGVNRISASNLSKLSDVLHLPIANLFAVEEGSKPYDMCLLTSMQKADCVRLNRAFVRILSARKRRMIVSIVGLIADVESENPDCSSEASAIAMGEITNDP